MPTKGSGNVLHSRDTIVTTQTPIPALMELTDWQRKTGKNKKQMLNKMILCNKTTMKEENKMALWRFIAQIR